MSNTLFYVFVTSLLALLIGGLIGAGFALGCRMSDASEEDGSDVG